jgi:hypothetical protein
MARLFISYRREDSGGWAGRVFDHLSQRFDRDQLFMDIDTIEPGLDFVEAIRQAVESCDVLIAFIGRHWLTATDPAGQRRLENPEDFVRLEIATALARNIRVIPVLVQDAPMPRVTDLPDDLKQLNRRNALQISDTRFNHDVGQLIMVLERVLGAAPSASPSTGPRGAVPPGQRDAAERVPKPPTPLPAPTPPVSPTPFRLSRSFINGLVGGMLGGAVAGLVIAVVYGLQLTRAPQPLDLMTLAGILLRIFTYAIAVGLMVGAGSQFGILWCRHAATEKRYPAPFGNEVTGGSLGGIAGGFVVGAAGGVYFADVLEMNLPVLTMPFLLGPTLFGTMFIPLGALLFNGRGRREPIWRAVVLALLLTWLLACLTVVSFEGLGISFEDTLGQSGVPGGVILGVSIGLLMGFQIGLTLWLYRRWAGLMEPMAC